MSTPPSVTKDDASHPSPVPVPISSDGSATSRVLADRGATTTGNRAPPTTSPDSSDLSYKFKNSPAAEDRSNDGNAALERNYSFVDYLGNAEDEEFSAPVKRSTVAALTAYEEKGPKAKQPPLQPPTSLGKENNKSFRSTTSSSSAKTHKKRAEKSVSPSRNRSAPQQVAPLPSPSAHNSTQSPSSTATELSQRRQTVKPSDVPPLKATPLQATLNVPGVDGKVKHTAAGAQSTARKQLCSPSAMTVDSHQHCGTSRDGLSSSPVVPQPDAYPTDGENRRSPPLSTKHHDQTALPHVRPVSQKSSPGEDYMNVSTTSGRGGRRRSSVASTHSRAADRRARNDAAPITLGNPALARRRGQSSRHLTGTHDKDKRHGKQPSPQHSSTYPSPRHPTQQTQRSMSRQSSRRSMGSSVYSMTEWSVVEQSFILEMDPAIPFEVSEVRERETERPKESASAPAPGDAPQHGFLPMIRSFAQKPLMGKPQSSVASRT